MPFEIRGNHVASSAVKHPIIQKYQQKIKWFINKNYIASCKEITIFCPQLISVPQIIGKPQLSLNIFVMKIRVLQEYLMTASWSFQLAQRSFRAFAVRGCHTRQRPEEWAVTSLHP